MHHNLKTQQIGLRHFPFIPLKELGLGLELDNTGAEEWVDLSRFPLFLRKLGSGEVKEVNELLTKIRGQLTRLDTVNQTKGEHQLQFLEYYLGGAMSSIEKIGELDSPCASRLLAGAKGFRKYFGVIGGIDQLVELREDVLALNDGLSNDWIQEKLDTKSLEMEQLGIRTCFAKSLSQALLNKWIQKRCDKGDITLKQMTDHPYAAETLREQAVQWCIDNLDNSKNLIQDIFSAGEEQQHGLYAQATRIYCWAKAILWCMANSDFKVTLVLSAPVDEMSPYIEKAKNLWFDRTE